MTTVRFGLLDDLAVGEVARLYSGCRLCWAIAPDGQRFESNVVLRQFDDFVLIPGLGGPDTGYVLLVSRNHRTSVAELSADELDALHRDIEELREVLQLHAPDWCWFEHGSLGSSLTSGRTVDHLHLHFLPLSHDLAMDVASRLSTAVQPLSSLHKLSSSVEGADNYILVANPDGKMSVTCPRGYPSQFVRQVVASLTGHSDLWDWRRNPLEDNCIATANAFRRCGISKPRVYFAHAIEGRHRETVEREVGVAREALAGQCNGIELVSMFELLEEPLWRLQGRLSAQEIDGLLVDSERRQLRVSDALLVDVSIPNHQYVGSLMEIAHAAALDIPIVCLVGQSPIANRRWLRAHCKHMATDLDEAVKQVVALLELRKAEHSSIPVAEQ